MIIPRCRIVGRVLLVILSSISIIIILVVLVYYTMIIAIRSYTNVNMIVL